MDTYELLRQGEVWISREGEVRIVDMSYDHIANTVRYLLDNAGRYEMQYTAYEICRLVAPEEASIVTHPLDAINRHKVRLDKRRRDAKRWIRSTPLYFVLWTVNYAPLSPPTPLSEAL